MGYPRSRHFRFFQDNAQPDQSRETEEQATKAGSEEEEANAHGKGEASAEDVVGGAIQPEETGAGLRQQERPGSEKKQRNIASKTEQPIGVSGVDGDDANGGLRDRLLTGLQCRRLPPSSRRPCCVAWHPVLRPPRMSTLNRAGEAEREKQSGRDERHLTAPTRRWRRSSCGILTGLPCQLRLPPHCAASRDEQIEPSIC